MPGKQDKISCSDLLRNENNKRVSDQIISHGLNKIGSKKKIIRVDHEIGETNRTVEKRKLCV